MADEIHPNQLHQAKAKVQMQLLERMSEYLEGRKTGSIRAIAESYALLEGTVTSFSEGGH